MEDARRQLVLKTSSNNKLVQNSKSKVETDTDLHYQSHTPPSAHASPACIIVISYCGQTLTVEFSAVSKLMDARFQSYKHTPPCRQCVACSFSQTNVGK